MRDKTVQYSHSPHEGGRGQMGRGLDDAVSSEPVLLLGQRSVLHVREGPHRAVVHRGAKQQHLRRREAYQRE